MPSPTTPLTLYQEALALTNAVGIDQTLTAAEITRCNNTFNDILENASTQPLFVYGISNQTFNTVAGQAVYTIGTGGDWNTDRPIRINQPGYTVYNSVSFPLLEMSQEQYDYIPVKGIQQQFAQRYLYVNSFPLGTITLWPVPSMVLPVTLPIDRQLTAITSAAQSISFPPGYAEAFKYQLAIKLPTIFGKAPPAWVIELATKSLADIKRANRKKPRAVFDVGLVDRNGYYGQWYY